MSNRSYLRTKAPAQSSSATIPANQVQARPFTIQTQALATRDMATQRDQASRFDANLMQNLGLQPKLTVGQPGDKYEQEADSVAAQVVEQINMPQTQAVQQQAVPEEEEDLQMKPLADSIRRQEMPEEEEELQAKPDLQQKADGGSAAAPQVESSIAQAKGQGQPLSDDVRGSMEGAFGADFSGVRVHTDAQSNQLNTSLQSRAFTTGQDIFFKQDEFSPGNRGGQELLAHELTHVVQQTGTIQKKPDITPATFPVIQRAVPAALAAIGTALVSETAVAASTVGSAAIGAAATVASGAGAIAPGSSGVETVQLESGWVSNTAKHDLDLITQYRLINAYVDHWVATHQGQSLSTTEEEVTTTSTTTGTTQPGRSRRSPSETASTTVTTSTRDAGPAQGGGEVDQAILSIVKTSVQRQIEADLNANTQSMDNQEFIWSDSGEHTADWFGTVGAVEFAHVRGSLLKETLRLNANASQIPNLVVPEKDVEKTVTQFRGGQIRRGPSMSIGYGDDLGINLIGGGPTKQHESNAGHGKHIYSMSWNWDDNTTTSDFNVIISPEDGTPDVSVDWGNTSPDDFSWI